MRKKSWRMRRFFKTYQIDENEKVHWMDEIDGKRNKLRWTLKNVNKFDGIDEIDEINKKQKYIEITKPTDSTKLKKIK